MQLQSNFIEITLRHGCSPVNLLHIFRTPFLRNTSEWLLLTSAVWNLNFPPFVDPSVEIDHIEDPILRIIKQYENHPSIVAITEKT